MAPIRIVLLEGEDSAGPAPGPEAAAAAAVARVQFLDARGRKVGRRRRVAAIPPPALETFGADGHIERVAGRGEIAFFTRLPEGATQLRLEQAGRATVESSVAAAASPRPVKPDSSRRFGSANPRFLLAAMAERFATEAAFHGHVAELLAAIEAAAPFESLPGRVAVDALFWKPPAGRGLFDPLNHGEGNDLVYGDRPLAAKFLERAYRGKARKPDRAIVLMNLPFRGGAGGDHHFPTAWTSITSGPGERWTDVALHEIGHGLGLGDEYDSENRDPPPGIEENISRSPDPRQAPWQQHVTHPAPVPTAPLHGGAGLPPDTIGTFQGARYSADLFRPQFRCRMRVASDPFCTICCALIRAKLA